MEGTREERYTFGVMHLGLLEETQHHLEAFGHTCRVEESEMAGYKLHTLVATPPVRPNREARGCNLPNPPTPLEIDRFLSGGAPDEYDHDKEEEFKDEN